MMIFEHKKSPKRMRAIILLGDITIYSPSKLERLFYSLREPLRLTKAAAPSIPK